MSELVEIGVIGAGSMGHKHLKTLASIAGVRLAGVFDKDQARAQSLGAEFGCQVWPDLETASGSAAAFTVAVPTEHHASVGSLLLDAGRHVFIEKPISDNLDGARMLIEKARAAQLVLQVGHVERFNPVLAELEKRLTQPRFIEAHRLSPFPGRSIDIGVVLDLMIHDLEIILHVVKSPLSSVDAVGVSVLTNREDIANARLRFENGCVANITTSRVSPERLRKIRVFQTDAYLSLDYMNQSGEIYFKGPTGIEKAEIQVDQQDALRLELSAFSECVAHGITPKVGGVEATKALELALHITDLISKTA